MRGEFSPASAQRRLDRWTAFGAAIDAAHVIARLTGADEPLDTEFRNALDALVAAQIRLAKLQVERALPTDSPR